MIISHKYRFIFVKTAKTAGTSIEVLLSQICEEEAVVTPFAFPEAAHRPRNFKGRFNPLPEVIYILRSGAVRVHLRETLEDYRAGIRFRNHTPAWRIRCRVEPQIWRDYFKWCVVRNPFETVLSGWHYYRFKMHKDISLNDYLVLLKKRKERKLYGVGSFPLNWYNYTDLRSGQVLVDRIAKYENLEDELRLIFRELRIPFRGGLSIRAKGNIRRDKRSYRDVLTCEWRRLIEELFREELEQHGYSY